LSEWPYRGFPIILCALQHLFNKFLYQNASKRDIQHIRPFAQSAHATICSAFTQPLTLESIGLFDFFRSDPPPGVFRGVGELVLLGSLEAVLEAVLEADNDFEAATGVVGGGCWDEATAAGSFVTFGKLEAVLRDFGAAVTGEADLEANLEAGLGFLTAALEADDSTRSMVSTGFFGIGISMMSDLVFAAALLAKPMIRVCPY
jgi:hypothetical protein